ncbi:MAG: bifunctional phosphoserine phosphatase/homoserine phosphotransferase ThrH [Desulfamplus sp.]|nr:bifunctional phosphoserine phosphatase/homoserine phosphotransferase ThrH [Desulfamplus sp.]MBF0389850.1 bifunctional phosphoserine phosphatase/homoserine phosphotransferase ThrH [Desulfamplus sp.]
MKIICSDLEGVFVPEIWINVAQKTGIDELKLTTREISDYDVLMTKRLEVLDKHSLKLKDITDIIATIEPLDGALEALNWIREQSQIIILSDTFEEFARPLMKKLDYPTLLCHSLVIDDKGKIADYKLRQANQKKQAIKALKGLNYTTIAFGDSYNDTAMLKEAHHGFFFRPPDNVVKEFPEFEITHTYNEVKDKLTALLQ